MFISVVLSIIGIFKTYPEKDAIIVDWPFRLHYMFTCAMVFFFTSIMGLQDAFGKSVLIIILFEKSRKSILTKLEEILEYFTPKKVSNN